MLKDDIIDYLESQYYKKREADSIKHIYFRNDGSIIRLKDIVKELKEHFKDGFKISTVTLAKYIPDRTNSDTLLKVKRREKINKKKKNEKEIIKIESTPDESSQKKMNNIRVL